MKKGFGGKKPLSGRPLNSGGSKKAQSGGKPVIKKPSGMKLSNVMHIDPTKFTKKTSKSMHPEDAEIEYLSQMLGLKKKKDLSSLMGEFQDEGLDDFLDLIFDEGIGNVEDDGTRLQRPVVDLDRKRGEVSLEDFMGGPPPSHFSSDSDMEEETLVSSNSKLSTKVEQKKEYDKSDPASKQSRELAKDAALAQSLLNEDSDDDVTSEFNATGMNDDDDDEEEDKQTKQKGKKATTSKSHTDIDLYNSFLLESTKKPQQSVKIQQTDTQKRDKKLVGLISGPNRYLPPPLRKRLGITTFNRTAMRDSFAKFLSTTESFVDVKNAANQNAYQYHAIMSKLEDNQDLALLIQSKINKLSYLNIAHIFNELIEDTLLAGTCGIGTFVDMFVLSICEFCQLQKNILSSTVQALGVLCAGFHKVFGTQYGSLMIETFVAYLTQNINLIYNEYLQNYTKNFSLSNHGVIYLIPTDIKPLLNLVDIIGTMYMMSSISPKFFFGLTEWILSLSSNIYQLTPQTQQFLEAQSPPPTTTTTTTSPSPLPISTSSTASPSSSNVSKLIQSLKASKTQQQSSAQKTLDPLELQTNIQWTLQCNLLSHLLIAFGLQLRKDDNSAVKLLLQTILDKSAGNEGSWHTQELIAVINDIRSNKQHVGFGDDAVSAKSKQPSATNATNIDYTTLREELFQAMNFILDNFNENLLEKSEEKKGRRETKKEQMKKQLAQMRETQMNKTAIATKYLQKHYLNITFTDILRVKETGRWWVVGSGFKQTQHGQNVELQPAKEEKKYRHLDELETATDDNSDGEDDFLVQVNTKQLLQLSEQLQFNSPLQRYVFSTIISNTDYTRACSAITSKHSNNANSSRSSTLSISITPSMYSEVVETVIKTCINEPQYRSYYSDILTKLLSTYPPYRFVCCGAFWDNIAIIQKEYLEIGQALKVLKKAAVGAKKALIEKKLTATKHKLKELSKRTSHLAKLAGDLVTQPLTIDLYILRKMAFTPTMWGLLEDSQNGDDNDGDNDGNHSDGDRGNEGRERGQKSKSKNPFKHISIISSNDLNTMDDNVILFLHTLLSRICERLTVFGLSLTPEEREQSIKNIIVPLQAPEMTNYLTMDKDLSKWQFTETSKYELVRRQDKTIRENVDGKRILSCITELFQTVVLPMFTASSSTNSTTANQDYSNDQILTTAKLFSKLSKKNHISRK